MKPSETRMRDFRPLVEMREDSARSSASSVMRFRAVAWK
jgi:hypothetical protein